MKRVVSFCMRILLTEIIRTTAFRFSELPHDGAPKMFDVTKYGAVADGNTECNKSFTEAWEAACGHPGNSTLYIPEGTYLLGPVTFAGPCHNNQSPEVKINGNLIAPSSLEAFPKGTWIEFKGVNRINVNGNLGVMNIDGQGQVEAWHQPSCKKSMTCEILISTLVLSDVSHGSISNITMSNSKGFHLLVKNSNNINIENVAIKSPADSPNTDGIHIGDSTNIAIISSVIEVGDDCVSIGPGSTNVTVAHVYCGPGHGISVGSLGKNPGEKDVRGITVEDCTINGTKNGVRLKTFPSSPPSSASNIIFQNIIMHNVSNPIIIDQKYCPSNHCNPSEPSKVQIDDAHFINISGTTCSKVGVEIQCSKSAPCRGLKLSNISLEYIGIGNKQDFTSNCSNANITYIGPQTPPPCRFL